LPSVCSIPGELLQELPGSADEGFFLGAGPPFDLAFGGEGFFTGGEGG